MVTRYFGRVSLESTAENSSNVYIAQMRNRGGYQASPGLQDMFLDKKTTPSYIFQFKLIPGCRAALQALPGLSEYYP